MHGRDCISKLCCTFLAEGLACSLQQSQIATTAVSCDACGVLDLHRTKELRLHILKQR